MRRFLLVLSCVLSAPAASAAEVKCFCPVAMRAVFDDLAPKFGQAAEHKLSVDLGTIGANAQRVARGDAADVAVLSPQQIDELVAQGKIIAGSRADIGRVGYAAFVRKGGGKPDLGSADAFKRAVLAAKAIGYGDPALGGPSGIYFASLMDKLGIGAEMKARTKLYPVGGAAVEAAAKGEIDIAFGPASDITVSPGVDLVPLTGELQSYTRYVAVITRTSTEPEAAKALIAFLTSPVGQASLKAHGFEPAQ
ncbi:MAG TPA: substrate-binding domain-containing protein [Beijerinckiaceae bacterium]|nr:substrate-binding domain-containing protein [Beijerinckiaceae bacterium]